MLVNGGDGDAPIIEPVGKYTVATRPHAMAEINSAVTMLRSYGEDVEQFDGDEIRRRLGSTSYLAGYHLRSANGLCDPARLTARLAGIAEGAGATIAEGSHVVDLRRRDDGVVVSFAHGPQVSARRVLLCTNAGTAIAATAARLRHPCLRPCHRHRATLRVGVERHRLARPRWSHRRRQPVPLLPTHARSAHPLRRLGGELPLRRTRRSPLRALPRRPRAAVPAPRRRSSGARRAGDQSCVGWRRRLDEPVHADDPHRRRRADRVGGRVHRTRSRGQPVRRPRRARPAPRPLHASAPSCRSCAANRSRSRPNRCVG